MTTWEKLTDGLALYEVLLFIFGSLLFLVLLFLIILFALRNKPLKPLLLFFIVPLIMLGWPSIAKIKIDATGVDLVKNLEKLEEDPDDPVLKEAVEQTLAELESKPISSPETLIAMAEAHFALGQEDIALQTLEQIPKDATQAYTGANRLRETILTTQEVRQKIEQVKLAPTDEHIEALEATKSHATQANSKLDNVYLQRYIRRSDSLINRVR